MVAVSTNGDSAIAIGSRVRALRRARGMTLKQLGAASSLSHPFLSQLERGLARPSVGSLERIAAALDTSVGELWTDGERPARAPRVVRHDEAERRPSGAATVREIADGSEPLSVHEWSGGAQRWPEQPLTRDGASMVYVLAGALELVSDKGAHRLERGDSALLDAGVAFQLRRVGGPSTRALIVARG